ncbi:aspartate 1-decarboxylase [Spirulina sp. 06S082]|uniref:aspartate 1-decarboxylase n=1 Tax=Spirulina sp. 06S082 TaxID=3110248 RepID=UPI002B20F216|nr:aspartate 1-decarboxylase [Spirulina sp. 06S082]MEA5469993.1 aspartate 1-decarboxylase [Spirulina sp. 06S082]
MGTIKLMHAKLHRVRVTEAKRHYVGSITIDRELLEQVGILPLEEVEIVNIENGSRWTTYVLPGEAGSGQICPNGGGALLCQPGDILIIWANEQRDRTEVMRDGHQARVLLADENNGIEKVFSQTLTPDGNTLMYNDGYETTNRSHLNHSPVLVEV